MTLDIPLTALQVTKERKRTMIEFSIPMRVTKEEAAELQKELGYHPGGYGFYSFEATDEKTTWQCGDSCD